jgi:Protein of unknown function (DUF3800)
MLIAYLDETGHSSDTSHVGIAGLIAEERAWETFMDAWTELLRHAGVSSLHMRHLAHFRGEYTGWSDEARRSLLRHALEAIRAANPAVVGAIMPMTAWNGLSDLRRQALVDPYCSCFQECMSIAAATGRASRQTVHMVFARNTEFAPKIPALWESGRSNPVVTEYVQDAFEFRSPREVLALQAADLVAYEFLQSARAREQGKEASRWPFKQLQRQPTVLLYMDRDWVDAGCPSDDTLRRAWQTS